MRRARGVCERVYERLLLLCSAQLIEHASDSFSGRIGGDDRSRLLRKAFPNLITAFVFFSVGKLRMAGSSERERVARRLVAFVDGHEALAPVRATRVATNTDLPTCQDDCQMPSL